MAKKQRLYFKDEFSVEDVQQKVIACTAVRPFRSPSWADIEAAEAMRRQQSLEEKFKSLSSDKDAQIQNLQEQLEILKQKNKGLKEALSQQKSENEAFIEQFDSEQEDLQQKNQKLSEENVWLKTQLFQKREKEGLCIELHFSEKELHPSEIQDFVQGMLYKAIAELDARPSSRLLDLKNDFLSHHADFSFDRSKTGQDQKEIMDIAEKLKDKPSDLKKELEKRGFADKTEKRSPHYKLCWHGDERYTIILAKTPSTKRGLDNSRSELISRCLF